MVLLKLYIHTRINCHCYIILCNKKEVNIYLWCFIQYSIKLLLREYSSMGQGGVVVLVAQ